ncbi:TonB-dependent receptor [Gluconobacter japonicus]|uniref:TonB-dependent receptor n=1 Tax=Gluconobacter japonicus TaxID=376620 RepID=UPI0007818981|nr:TonB-dependent receptor [Gluconobacter japonicus]KXV22849.1 TonB-dependent receptor [Gluconobacter japonicus]
MVDTVVLSRSGLRRALIASCSMMSLVALDVRAAAATDAARRNAATAHLGQKSSLGHRTPAARHAVLPVAKDETVQVTGARTFGGGRMARETAAETISSLSHVAIAQRTAIASPLQLAASMPGVNFGTSDAYGLSIRNFISVRGLDQTEMGWVVEGMPGTDQAYYYPYIETWADNENIADMKLLPGTSRLEDPVQSASGGEMIMSVRSPADKIGGHLDYSAGSYRGQRVFARFDSGYLGNSGLKFFGSYSYAAADNFVGSGRNNRTHVDFKLQKDLGRMGKSSLFVSYTDWNNARLNFYSLSQWESANRIDNNFSAGNYAGTYTPGVTTNYWRAYDYRRKNVLISWQNELHLTDRMTLHVTPYFHWTDLNSPGQTFVNPDNIWVGNQKVQIDASNLYLTSKGVAAMSNVAQSQFATGVNAYLNYDITRTNHLTFGYWYDHWNMSQINGLTPMDQYGNAPYNSNYLHSTSGELIANNNFQESSQINQFYISDTQSLLNDRLKLTAGFKYMMDYISGTNMVPGAPYHFSSTIAQPMPRVSAAYDITKNLQVYLNGMTNTRPPVPISTYPTTYGLTGSISQSGAPNTKPEYSIGEELGFRYHDNIFSANVAFFNMNLTNHQVVTLRSINGAPVSEAVSLGGETIRGVTAEVATRSWWGFAPYVNAQYLNARMDNNLGVMDTSSRLDYLPTSGKTMVMSPKFMASVGVHYNYRNFFGNLDFHWVDSQYSTFMNDQSMPAYKTVDLGIGYRFKKVFAFQSPTIRLNFTNLTNVKYLSSVAVVGNNAIKTRGVNGGSIAAGSASYYLGAPLAVMMTVGTDF